MYFKHVHSYKRDAHLKNSKRKVTLNHIDAVLRCYALIFKMARLRFPGRPGQRIGKNYIKYMYDDIKIPSEPILPVHNKIEAGLKLFHELFGYSDEEEEEFDGFTAEEIAEAKKALAASIARRLAVQRYLSSKKDPPSGASDVEKFLSTSTDSDASTSSIRQKRGMRDILRKSYDKMLKEGLCKSTIHANTKKEEKHLKTIKSDDHSSNQFHQQNIIENKQISNDRNLITDINKTKNNLNSLPHSSESKSIVKRILERAKQKSETKGRKRKELRSRVRKKFKSNFSYPTRKFTPWKKRLSNKTEDKNVVLNQTLKHCRTSMLPQIIINEENNEPSSSKLKNEKIQPKLRSKRQNARKFVLPSRSVRSARKIIPRKRYIDDTNCKDRKDDEESHCSRSSFSGNSETTSAMDGGSSPEDSHNEDNVESSYLQKKIGLLDRPLVVEGKRPWKPSLKVQMKLSDMNCEYPFALKKSGDESSGTNTSSGSFKDIIKPDMVSKYAEKMAQKPKEKALKPSIENTKRNIHPIKYDEPCTPDVSLDVGARKKPEDKLEKVAAKIEKLLKSQWEGRLKETSTTPSRTYSGKNKINKNVSGTLESAVAQWKSEQQQRSSSQRRTKSIIRKAKLHLEKKNLNLRTRKTVKEPYQVVSLTNKKQKIELENEVLEKTDLLSPVNLVKVPSKETPSIVTSVSTSVLTDAVRCVICGYSKLFTLTQKLYDEVACGACNKFFEVFVKSPKQYFCTKDGNCSIDSMKEASRKSVSARCKACWLKVCMERFTVSATLRSKLINYIPRLDTPPHNALILDTLEEAENLEELKVDGIIRGPRIKHVCRRAAVVLGLPRATFSDKVESKEAFNLSALPQEEKQKILETVPLTEEALTTSETVIPVVESKPIKSKKELGKKKVAKPPKLKNHVHLDVLKQSSLLIQKEQKRRKMLMKKSMKHLHKHSFKKSMKLGKKNQMKKTLKFSYKSAVKTTSVKRTQRTTQYARTKKMRKVRCKQCEGCLADDCGKCAYCLDKKKFGGPDTIKQACMYRRCLKPAFPASSERKASKQAKPSSPSKLSTNRLNFDGDGPSGMGLSLTSSSSSPTSPDNSSCNSSCSSSTSSSSSASSESSSSSSSGSSSSSTSSSSSDNISISHASSVRERSIKTPFLQSAPLGSTICQKKENSDITLNTSSVLNASFFEEEYENESDYQDLTPCALAEPCESNMLNGSVVHNENGDTILYENSSSMIQLKNASYAPSLMYSAAYGENEDTLPYNSGSGGWKNSNSKNNYKQSQINQNWDQYGSAGSGDQESNEDDEDSNKDQDDNSKKKHYIYADYWEDYDFERISAQGFALISSQQIPLPCACYLCGSYGEERLIFCVLCCEPYHLFCLPEQDVPHEENIENWCCKRCQSCAVCGLKNNLLKCKKCQNTYHSECLTPHYPTKPSKKKRIWMCPKCVKCKSCGTSTQSGGGHMWNFDLLLCQSCAKLTDKGIDC